MGEQMTQSARNYAISEKDSAQTFKLGELFAGAGGTALGAHMAQISGFGFEHAWVNDKDSDACKTLARNIPIQPEFVFDCDVADLSFDRLPEIDGFVFGFPCNDFSVVGDHHGIAGHYGGLYRWGIQVLEKFKPLFFLAENVSGLASSGDDFEIIKNDLVKAGYNIFPRLYKFEQYGVPQNRQRIIVVGFRDDLKITEFCHPEPTTLNDPVTVIQALAGIKTDAANNEFTNQSATVIERLKHIKPGENAFTANLPDHLKLNLRSGATISQIYKRLEPNKPAYTVTGSGGGGTHIYHWKEHRALTNRERARLQSFPDSFIFEGGKESVRRQIGMAVPPLGAQIIFESILKTLVDHQVVSQC